MAVSAALEGGGVGGGVDGGAGRALEGGPGAEESLRGAGESEE